MEFITPFFMWLFLVVLPNVGTILTVFFLTSAIGLILFAIFAIPLMSDGTITREIYKKTLKYLIIACSCFSLMSSCIPNKKELAAIVLVPAIIHNEQVQNIGNSSLQVLQGYLDAYIEEFKPEVKK